MDMNMDMPMDTPGDGPADGPGPLAIGPLSAMTDVPSEASLAGMSGGGHEQVDSPTAMGMMIPGLPVPPNGGRPV